VKQAQAQAQAQAQVALLLPLSECVVFFLFGIPRRRLFFSNWSFPKYERQGVCWKRAQPQSQAGYPFLWASNGFPFRGCFDWRGAFLYRLRTRAVGRPNFEGEANFIFSHGTTRLATS